jgi:DNA-binding FrmR family transcriptional regulator
VNTSGDRRARAAGGSLCARTGAGVRWNTLPGYGVLLSAAADRPPAVEEEPLAGYSGTKDDYSRRLRRIEGQVRGIHRMVEEDVYCIDVLTQVAAVTRALQAVSLGLLEDHVGHCVVDAARESDEAAQAKIREATDAIARLVRT